MNQLLGLPELASAHGHKVDNFIGYVHWLMIVLFVGWFLAWIPFVGWLWGIFLLVCLIMGMVAAFGGKYQKLPLIGAIAEKLTF